MLTRREFLGAARTNPLWKLAAVMFVLMFVAVFLGNEASSAFDGWYYCTYHPMSIGCGK